MAFPQGDRLEEFYATWSVAMYGEAEPDCCWSWISASALPFKSIEACRGSIARKARTSTATLVQLRTRLTLCNGLRDFA